MAVIIPPGYAQVTLTFNAPNTFRGQTALVLGFGGPLGDDPESLEGFAIEVGEAWRVHMAPQMDSQVTLINVRVVGPQTAAEAPVSIVGGATLADAPPQVALLLSHATPRRGRRARGRSYLYGFLSSGNVGADGVIAASRLTQVRTAWDGFIAQITDPINVGVEHVILQGDTGTSAPLSPPPEVTSTTLQPRIATQRRRVRR